MNKNDEYDYLFEYILIIQSHYKHLSITWGSDFHFVFEGSECSHQFVFIDRALFLSMRTWSTRTGTIWFR